jgi:hypothetical protein
MSNKPEPGKLYSLTGGPGKPSIAAGNTWAESEVKKSPPNVEPDWAYGIYVGNGVVAKKGDVDVKS